MPAECYEYFCQLLANGMDSGDRKTYIFCSVVFSDYGKPYYYLTDNEQIHCGDQVLVPTGKNNEVNTARVVKVEAFQGSNAPVPVEKLKKIIDVL
jgi:hypothetical protein